MKTFPFIRVGLILAFLPMLLAIFASMFIGGSMWDEGMGSGAYMWMLICTMPLGFLLIIVGLLIRLLGKN